MAMRPFTNGSPVYTVSCDLWPILSPDMWAHMSDRQLSSRMFTLELLLFRSSTLLLPRPCSHPPHIFHLSKSSIIDPIAVSNQSQDSILPLLSLTLYMQSTWMVHFSRPPPQSLETKALASIWSTYFYLYPLFVSSAKESFENINLFMPCSMFLVLDSSRASETLRINFKILTLVFKA